MAGSAGSRPPSAEITGPLQPTGARVEYRPAYRRRDDWLLRSLGLLHVGLALALGVFLHRWSRTQPVVTGRRIGQLLMTAGLLTENQLADLLDLQVTTEGPWQRLGDLAVDAGYVTQAELAAATGATSAKSHPGPLRQVA